MSRIRFVTGTGAVSAGIRAFEHLWRDDGWLPTHAEVLMPDGTLLGAHLEGGVQARPVGYDKATMTREMFVDLPFGACIDISAGSSRQFEIDRMEAKFYGFLRAQLGKPYDMTAIAAFVFDRDWRQADSWFCSELVAAALEECSYLPKLISPTNRITPSGLLSGLSFRVPIPDAAQIPKAEAKDETGEEAGS